MADEALTSRRAPTAAAVAMAVLGGAVVVAATGPFGPGVTPDSTNYLKVAQSLSEGDGYDYYGEILTVFPPGFPAVLAVLLRVTSLSPLDAGRYLNIALATGIVWVTYLAATRLVDARWLALAPAVIVVGAPVVVHVATHVWSEPLFILLALASFVLLHDLTARDGLALGRAAVLGLVLAGAVLTRFAGIPVVAAVGLTALVVPTRLDFRTRLRRSAVVVGIPMFALGLWGVVLAALSGSWYGRGYSRSVDLGDYFVEVRRALRDWVAPAVDGRRSEVLLVVAFLLAIPLAVGVVRRLRRLALTSGPSAILLALVVFVPLYLVFLLAARRSTTTILIDSRILSPIFVPLVLLAVTGFDELLRGAHSPRRRLVCAALAAGGTLLALAGADLGVEQVRALRAEGAPGATDSAFRAIPLADVCAEARTYEVVVSNRPELISFWCEQPFDYSPFRGEGGGTLAADTAGLRADIAEDGPAYLMWLRRDEGPSVYPPSELARALHLRRLRSVTELDLYEIRN